MRTSTRRTVGSANNLYPTGSVLVGFTITYQGATLSFDPSVTGASS